MDDMRGNLIELTTTLRTREAEAQAVLAGVVEVCLSPTSSGASSTQIRATHRAGAKGAVIGRFW
jgi:hypothetical protein